MTNAGGPGVLATDALVAGGGELAELSPETMAAFDEILPPQWSHNNPVDILGDAEPERYAKALEIAAKDPASDGMLVILTPQDMTDPTQIAEKLKPYAKGFGKPVLASWMGGAEVAAGEEILNQAGIPTFPFPDSAVRAFNYMWRYAYNLRGLYETPTLPQHADAATAARQGANASFATPRQQGRTILTEFESKQLLAAYGIPTVETRIAVTEDEAVQGGRGDRLPGRPQAALGDHHAQDRRRRRAAESARRRRGAQGLPGDQGVRSPRRPAPSTSRASPCSRWSSSTATS